MQIDTKLQKKIDDLQKEESLWRLTKTKMPRDKDRRVTISDAKRRVIAELKGLIGQTEAARLTGVSPRMVQFMWYPERLERNKKVTKRKKGRYKRTTEKARAVMQEHLIYKKKVIEESTHEK